MALEKSKDILPQAEAQEIFRQVVDAIRRREGGDPTLKRIAQELDLGGGGIVGTLSQVRRGSRVPARVQTALAAYRKAGQKDAGKGAETALPEVPSEPSGMTPAEATQLAEGLKQALLRQAVERDRELLDAPVSDEQLAYLAAIVKAAGQPVPLRVLLPFLAYLKK